MIVQLGKFTKKSLNFILKMSECMALNHTSVNLLKETILFGKWMGLCVSEACGKAM